ncbi:hypothetical protein BKA65DRAFT_518647 [Rhexocercosporidium sp. MPI-PUGE-AT-0058]|nr:hypothetical protein BKA65DRAFT_518647 [Rhexocercosporidium sp. MPI-PUGE-AT-0058]
MKLSLSFFLFSTFLFADAFPNALEARYIGQECHGGVGVCEYTSNCRSLGGRSNPANLCPGPDDVQCCEDIPCRRDTGICKSISLCHAQLDSAPICPGGNDFQCCYIKGVS